jgi:hypothetical protein
MHEGQAMPRFLIGSNRSAIGSIWFAIGSNWLQTIKTLEKAPGKPKTRPQNRFALNHTQ